MQWERAGGFGRQEHRGGGRDTGHKGAGGSRMGLSRLGMRSRGTSARQGEGAGGDGDLLIPAALCLFTSRGICSGERHSTEGEASEPSLTGSQGMSVPTCTLVAAESLHLWLSGAVSLWHVSRCDLQRQKLPLAKQEKELLLLIINEISPTALKTRAILFGKCNEKIN